MINLKIKVGSGRHRDCYRHPQDDNKCIKILYNPADGGMKEVKREMAYYRKRSRQIRQCRSVPDFYGKVETDRGEGYVFDLIRDYDGQISKTLEFYLKHHAFSLGVLENKLYDLRNDLIAHNISTMNLKHYNILYRKTDLNEGYLVIIDNIGESEFFPVASLFNFLHRRKINRIFSRFFARLNLREV